MVLCCCNWSGVAKLKYICIHDYFFAGFTIIGILGQIMSRDPGGVVIFVLHLVLVNIPRFVSDIMLMRRDYSNLWAKRCMWTRVITLVVQIILDTQVLQQ